MGGWMGGEATVIWRITSEEEWLLDQLVTRPQHDGYPPWNELLILAPCAWTLRSTLEPFFEAGTVFLSAHGLAAGAEALFLWGLFRAFLRVWGHGQDGFILQHVTQILSEYRAPPIVSLVQDLVKQVHLLLNFINHLHFKVAHVCSMEKYYANGSRVDRI